MGKASREQRQASERATARADARVLESSLAVTGCHAKIERANEYLADFNASSHAWLQAEADKIVREHDPQTCEFRLVLKKAPKAPARLSIIVGDVLSSFRSCLDHLMYAVAVHESQQEPPPNAARLAFPVVDTNEADFDGRWAERLEYLSVEARAEIKNLQPFRESPVAPPGEIHWLYALDKLNNIYKHRRLGVIAMKPGKEVKAGANEGVLTITWLCEPGPLKDDTILLGGRTEKPNVEVRFESSFEVGLDEPDVFTGNPNVSELLVTIGDNVWAVVNRLRALY